MKPAQSEFFASQGYLRLEGFYPARRITAIKQKVLEEFKRLSTRANLAGSLRSLPHFQQIARLSALVKVPGLHEALATTELTELIADWVDGGWRRVKALNYCCLRPSKAIGH